MTDLRAFATALPKAELHLHLEGTLEPELRFALAERNGIELAETTVDEMRATYVFDDLTSFLAVYYPAMAVLITEDDFHDLAWAYLLRAQADGVTRAEMFFDPQAHTSRGVAFDTVIRGLRRAVERAEPELGISADLILCFLRDLPASSALETLEAALPYRDWILGVGLDSDERDNPPAKFADVFAAAREAGFKLTMHCDIDQVGSIDNIRWVTQELDVDRIDHGTNIVEDPALVEVVVASGVGLTCCPISNSFVTSDMKGAEIVDLLGRGAKVTINSDDPAYFGGYVADNYVRLATEYGLGVDDLTRLAVNSFEASWLPADEIATRVAGVRAFAAGWGGAGQA